MRFALALLTAATALAQLPFSATYDASRTIRLQGSVSRVEWVNPRAYIFVETKDSNWAVEIGNPLQLEASGWNRDRVKPGDAVTVEGNPAHGQSKIVFGRAVSLTVTGQKVFVIDAQRPPVARAAPAAPRWPNGHVRLGPAPGEKGYWGRAADARLFETQTNPVAMDATGLLSNLSDAERVAPLLPWAKGLYEYRQRSLFRDDPALRCMPPGGPRQFQAEVGFQFVEQPELGRILVLHGGGNRNWRIIYTDGRPLMPADEVVAGYYGTSVGKWDGDTLIVESTGYNENFWFSNGGLPHTEALRLTERFTRTNLNALRYDVTVNDPRAYSRPWTGGWTIPWVAGKEIEEYFCEENAESTFER
ncbi:MAG: DUF6152 family protein [Bryobacteraceae bacterium]